MPYLALLLFALLLFSLPYFALLCFSSPRRPTPAPNPRAEPQEEAKAPEETKSQAARDGESQQRSIYEYLRRWDKLKAMADLEWVLGFVSKQLHWRLCTEVSRYRTQPGEFEERLQKNDESGHYIFKRDWQRDEKKGTMFFLNEQIRKNQRQVIAFMLKQIGSNLLSGKSFMQISLPITIIEKQSNLERLAKSFVFAPVFLEQAAKSEDPVEQMKLTMTFLLTTTLMYLNLEKPFNPILGETFQGYIKGCPIYFEQISHHPPIAAFQLIGRGYRYEGQIETVARIHANSVDGINVGELRVTFEQTQNSIVIMAPPGQLSGTSMGDHTFMLIGNAYGYDLKNNLFSQITYNPDKKGFFSIGKQATTEDSFRGGIYRINQGLRDQLLKKYQKRKFIDFPGLNMQKDVVRIEANIAGLWDQFMEIDGKVYFHADTGPFPYAFDYELYPLASDCRFRDDVIVWKYNDEKKAQQKKEELEVIQRHDRKLRENWEKEKKKQK